MRHRGIKPRTFGISLLIIFILAVWLKNVYDDKSWVESDFEICKISSMHKDTDITTLSKKIDSLNKQIDKLKKPNIVYLPGKPIYIPISKNDTINTDTTMNIILNDTSKSQ